MISSEPIFSAYCDGCGSDLPEPRIPYSSLPSIVDELDALGWHIDGHDEEAADLFCPDCWAEIERARELGGSE